MSWDEALFSAAWHGARRLLAPRVSEETRARQVDVEPERERLEALARLLTGAPIDVALTDEAGGVCGDTFFLPRVFDFAPASELNRAAMVLRVAWCAVVHGLGLTAQRDQPLLEQARLAPRVRARLVEQLPAVGDLLPRLERAAMEARPKPDEDDLQAQAVEAAVRLALGGAPDEALPAAAWAWAEGVHRGEHLAPPPAPRRWWSPQRPPAPVPLWGALLAGRAAARPTVPTSAEALAQPTTERAKPKATRLERVAEPEQQLAENPLVHSFEKVHTLDTYRGGSKRIDGDDELAAHQKALDELDLRQVVRSHQRAKSLYRADVLLDDPVGDLEEDASGPAEALYDEWDEARLEWRRQWCRLTTRVVPVAPDVAGNLQALRARMARTTTGLRAVFEHLEAARAWRLRQRTGTDVDVDALVARYGALRAGECSEHRLYATRRRHTRDTAVLVLLDASLSTDAWVANRRVLDVEKESVIALGDALDGLFDEVAVAAFCSQSRRDCRFLVAKGFRESWDVGARRVMSLEPAGFTRIGPALRHATAELLECGARQKLLLLVSDGKPSDIDRYEGKYGVADVHRAVLDAHAVGVVTHALAMDPSAKAWLPSMFGPGRASVVARPGDLVTALARMTSGALRS
jgi:nitric oxide reductase NorD protein